MLTQENVAVLNEFLEDTGALKGLDARQARAVCVDLVWKVGLLVEEAVDRNVKELMGRELSCS